MSATTDTERLRDGWEGSTPSSDTLLLAGFRAMMARSVGWALAAGGRVQQSEQTVLTDSGSDCRYLNEVITTGPVDRRLLARAARFYPAGRPFVVTSPGNAAGSLGEAVTLVGHPPFMFRPPGGRAPQPPTGVHVEEVLDPAGLAIWAQLVGTGFGEPTVLAPAAALGGPHRFWIARWHGEPAAASSAFVAANVTDVEAVATVPHLRGHGLGEAVSWAATLTAPALPAILLASDLGRPIYQRMGYLPVCRVTMWTGER
jgi:hypothetical protein